MPSCVTGGIGVAQGRFLSPRRGAGRPTGLCDRDPGRHQPVPARVAAGDKRILVTGGFPFEVIGVLEKQGQFLGASASTTRSFIPVRSSTAFSEQPGGWTCTSRCKIKALDVKAMDDLAKEVLTA